jgi:hypothetical protein
MQRASAAFLAIVISATVAVLGSASAAAGGDQDKDRKPKLSLRANPAVSFSPSRIYFSAELRGGPDDYEEYYCPTVEWDWGDGTESEANLDCEPYESGRSEIKRRYSAVHVYQYSGRYTVVLRLKRNNKVLVASNTSIQVRPGPRDVMMGSDGAP